MDSQIMVRTPKVMRDEFKILAIKQGKTMSDLLRDHIEAQLKAAK